MPVFTQLTSETNAMMLPGLKKPLLLLLTIFAIVFSQGYSQQHAAAAEENKTGPRTPLVELSKRISLLLNKPVAVNRDAPASITAVRDTLPESLPLIRQLLQDNGLILFEGEDAALIVRQEQARHLPLPVILDTHSSRSEFEWVTLVTTIGDLSPDQVVSSLRQTIPSYGHLSVHSSARAVMVTAPFGSIEIFLKQLKRARDR